MFHKFTKGNLNPDKCSVCHTVETEHKCVVCEHPLVEGYMTMLFCEPCKIKEIEAQKENEAAANQRVAELDNNRSLPPVPQPDSTIQVSHDIFNAKIASIEEWRKEIESDTTIENKHFALASRMQARFEHLKNVINEAQTIVRESGNEQRAIQTYYNELAKKLKAEEREKIRLQDVQYNPPAKPVKTSTPKAPSTKKYNKAEIRDAAAKSGLPEAVIQMTCVARNITPLEAIQVLKNAGM